MKQKVFAALLTALFILPLSLFASAPEVDFAKAEVISTPEITDSGSRQIRKVHVLVLSGKYKGIKTDIEYYLWDYKGYNLHPSKGDKIILSIVKDYDGSIKFFINSKYRSPYLYLAAGIFVILFFIVAGSKKRGAFIMLLINLFFIIPALFLIIRTGFNPLAAGMAVCGTGIIISTAVILGRGRKLISAVAGAFTGVFSAGILTAVFMDYMNIEAGFVPGSRMIIAASRYIAAWNITDLRGIVAAGIMIASLGAVIDIAVSIVSAVNEVYLKSRKKAEPVFLFKSGLNVGRDMVATMLNSLVLVFAGVSLPAFLVLTVLKIPFLKFINFEFILIAILSALISSIALMLTVPATAYISSKMLSHE